MNWSTFCIAASHFSPCLQLLSFAHNHITLYHIAVGMCLRFVRVSLIISGTQACSNMVIDFLYVFQSYVHEMMREKSDAAKLYIMKPWANRQFRTVLAMNEFVNLLFFMPTFHVIWSGNAFALKLANIRINKKKGKERGSIKNWGKLKER